METVILTGVTTNQTVVLEDEVGGILASMSRAQPVVP